MSWLYEDKRKFVFVSVWIWFVSNVRSFIRLWFYLCDLCPRSSIGWRADMTGDVCDLGISVFRRVSLVGRFWSMYPCVYRSSSTCTDDDYDHFSISSYVQYRVVIEHCNGFWFCKCTALHWLYLWCANRTWLAFSFSGVNRWTACNERACITYWWTFMVGRRFFWRWLVCI